VKSELLNEIAQQTEFFFGGLRSSHDRRSFSLSACVNFADENPSVANKKKVYVFFPSRGRGVVSLEKLYVDKGAFEGVVPHGDTGESSDVYCI
jgi:hypothetical protein